MKYSKEEIEVRLQEMLNDLLRGGNQDGSILELNYDPINETANVKLSVFIVEEDDYVGFQSY